MCVWGGLTCTCVGGGGTDLYMVGGGGLTCTCVGGGTNLYMCWGDGGQGGVGGGGGGTEKQS